MAFVSIRKGKRSLRVSQKAYESIYYKNGYRKIDGSDTEKAPAIEETEEIKLPGEDAEQDINSIPISDMTKAQLMEFAKEHNIDTSSARNVREAREIIREALRKAEE